LGSRPAGKGNNQVVVQRCQGPDWTVELPCSGLQPNFAKKQESNILAQASPAQSQSDLPLSPQSIHVNVHIESNRQAPVESAVSGLQQGCPCRSCSSFVLFLFYKTDLSTSSLDSPCLVHILESASIRLGCCPVPCSYSYSWLCSCGYRHSSVSLQPETHVSARHWLL